MSRQTTTSLSLALSAAPRSAAMARSALHRLDLDPDTHADVALLVSELVSAAIHATAEDADDVRVEIASGPVVRTEVTAAAPGLAELAERDEPSHGFTIRLLDDLAASWGGTVDGHGDGAAATVWFEVARHG